MLELSGKKALVIGAGLSGVSAARLLINAGAEVVVFDSNNSGRLDEKDIAASIGGEFNGRIVLSSFTEELYDGTDLMITSPGVPIDGSVVLGAKDRGIKVIGEIELAYLFAKGRIVGVTGTNGKTTTTALTGHIMKQFVQKTIVVGNIGTPYTALCTETDDDSVTVVELSSFQLDTTETFRPDVSMILNITPDHLDRHHTMENYINAKFCITRHQTSQDICILNYEDAELRKRAGDITARVVWFSSSHVLEDGYYYKDGAIMCAVGGKSEEILRTDRMQLIGVHNYENVMAAVAAARYLGVPTDVVREAVYSFKPVAHRIEYVRTVCGVKYYNDSKGTNPDASIRAVQAMTGPTLLIGGGYDKGSTYDEWIESFGGRIKELVLMGATAEKIAACARAHGFNNITFVSDMKEAVEFCSSHAEPGDFVLLSPCCASWGMFKNYEERGDRFKELVNSL